MMNLKTSPDWTILDSCKTDFKEFGITVFAQKFTLHSISKKDVLSLVVHGTVVKLKKVFSQ